MGEILQKACHVINCGNVQVVFTNICLQHLSFFKLSMFSTGTGVFELGHREIASLWLGSWLCRGLVWWPDHRTYFLGIHASKIHLILSHLVWPSFIMPSVGKIQWKYIGWASDRLWTFQWNDETSWPLAQMPWPEPKRLRCLELRKHDIRTASWISTVRISVLPRHSIVFNRSVGTGW